MSPADRMQQSLIICATPRSGSYLLSDLLQQSGLPFAEEWLTPFHQSSRKKAYGEKESLGFLEYLKLLSEKERRNGIFAIKIMYPQFYRLMQELAGENDPSGKDWFEEFKSLFPDPFFIHVTRRNKLAQAISHLKARQTGRWVKRRGRNEEKGIEPVYSYLGICKALEDREQSEELWNEHFREHNIPVMRIVYEDLVEHGTDALREILAAMNLPFDEVRSLEQTRTFLPMASSVNREWEERFRQDRENSRPEATERPNEDLSRLEIAHVDLRENYEVGKRYYLDVEVTNNGAEAFSPMGRADGQGWLRVAGALLGPGEEEPDPFEQELRTIQGGRLVARCLLPVGKAADIFTLKLVLASSTMTMEEVKEVPGKEYPLHFKHAPPRDKSRELLPGVIDLRNGWQYLDWFGYFLDDKFPWIYTADHEWLYFKPKRQENGSYHVLDANLGWLEMDPVRYPEVRSLDEGADWTFLRRDGDKRWFRNEASGDNFRTETNRPEHLQKLNTD